MRLWEEVTDERGDKFASELGRATWDQTPNSPKRDLVIELNARPQSDTLFLETDNGDNPPIELRDFRSYYPVTRVVFKATPDPAQPVWLYYGNLDATAPHYDLTLVAGELLRAERSTVTAGAEENLSPKPSLVGQTLTGSTRYIFWGALALGCDRAARDHVALSAQSAATMISRFAAIFGAVVLVTIIFAISVGWLLAHPVQTAIGNPPADLNANQSLSRAIQVQLSTVGGARSRMRMVLCCCYRAFARIG